MNITYFIDLGLIFTPEGMFKLLGKFFGINMDIVVTTHKISKVTPATFPGRSIDLA